MLFMWRVLGVALPTILSVLYLSTSMNLALHSLPECENGRELMYLTFTLAFFPNPLRTSI